MTTGRLLVQKKCNQVQYKEISAYRLCHSPLFMGMSETAPDWLPVCALNKYPVLLVSFVAIPVLH